MPETSPRCGCGPESVCAECRLTELPHCSSAASRSNGWKSSVRICSGDWQTTCPCKILSRKKLARFLRSESIHPILVASSTGDKSVWNRSMRVGTRCSAWRAKRTDRTARTTSVACSVGRRTGGGQGGIATWLWLQRQSLFVLRILFGREDRGDCANLRFLLLDSFRPRQWVVKGCLELQDGWALSIRRTNLFRWCRYGALRDWRWMLRLHRSGRQRGHQGTSVV